MPSRRERAIRAAYRVENSLYDVEAATLRRIRRDLEAARDATIVRLAGAGAEWDIRQTQAILAELERQMVAWDQQAGSAVTSAMADGHTIGREQTLAAARAGGIEIVTSPLIGTATLSVSQQTLPLLIREVGDDTVRAVSRILRSVVLGQSTPYEAMQTIARFIPPSGPPGPFGAAFRRAESIVRTEVGRIAQTANHSTLLDMARRDGDWMKEWQSSLLPNTRDSHSKAHGQRVEAARYFRVGGANLLYPHDPRGPARETVNCRCISVPVHKTWTRGGRNTPAITTLLGL